MVSVEDGVGENFSVGVHRDGTAKYVVRDGRVLHDECLPFVSVRSRSEER